MADLEKTVSIIFSGKDDVSKSIRGVAGAFDQLDSLALSVADPLAKVADGVLKIDAALAALAAGGLVYAYVKSKEFESATTNLSKILGDQKDQIGGISVATIDMSNKYGIAATSLVESATDFKRAGFAVNEVLGLTENSIGLVIGAAEAELQQAQATEIIIATLKGFKAPAEEAGRLTDILNKVSNEYATSVTELGTGMANLSPVAHKMGFSFEETAGILTPVIEIFRSGDEASTALRTGLLKLVDDAKPVRDALASIGVSQTDANGNLRSGRDILFDVAKAFQHVDENQKLYVASQLVGIRQAAKMVEVFDGLKYSTEITNVALAAGGSIAQEVAAKLATSEVAVNRLVTGFTNLAIVSGDKFRVAATGAVLGVTDIENALQALVTGGELDEVFDALNDFSASLGDFLKKVAEALPEAFAKVDFDGLLDSLGDMGREIGELFGDLDLTTPEGLAKAIQGAVNTIESLIDITRGMVSSFAPIFEGILGFIQGFNALDEQSKLETGNLLGAAKAVVDAGFLIVGALVLLGENSDVVTRVFQTTSGVIKGIWNTLEVAFSSLVSLFTDSLIWILKAVEGINWVSGFGGLNKALDETIHNLENFKFGVEATQAEDFQEGLDGYAQALKGVAGEAGDATRQIKDLGGAVAEVPDKKETEVEAKGYDYWLNVVNQAVAKSKEIPPKVEQDITVKAKVDEKSVAEVKKKVDTIPVEKLLEIELKGDIDKDIAKIKTQAETVQTAVEWKAKLDIAEAEANAKIVEAAFGSVSDTITATTGSITDLFGLFNTGLGWFREQNLARQIEEENKARERALDLQEKLVRSQTKYMDARTEALKSGESRLIVQADGLAPHLEAIWHEIMGYVQVRANESQAEFLIAI